VLEFSVFSSVLQRRMAPVQSARLKLCASITEVRQLFQITTFDGSIFDI